MNAFFLGSMIEADLARPKPPPTLSPTTKVYRAVDAEGSGLLDPTGHKHYGNSSTLSPDNAPSFVQPANYDAYDFMKDLPNGKFPDYS
jgi:hypothetical protein